MLTFMLLAYRYKGSQVAAERTGSFGLSLNMIRISDVKMKLHVLPHLPLSSCFFFLIPHQVSPNFTWPCAADIVVVVLYRVLLSLH